MAVAFLPAYTEVCEACETRPHRYIVDICEAQDSNDAEPTLPCNGNGAGLREQRLLDMDAQLLIEALSKGHPFVSIDLSYNHLSLETAKPLASLLDSDCTLQQLDLAHTDFNEQAIALICDGLQHNHTLQRLRLDGCELRDEGGFRVAELLQKNTALRQLQLNGCSLGTRSLVALATALHSNSSLEALEVSRPLCPSTSLELPSHFSRMLSVNRTITSLDMSKCGMRDDGLHLLATGLLRAGPASVLSHLRLSCNQITLFEKDCVAAVTQLLSSPDCSLTLLDLSSNRLGNEGALVLSEVLQANTSLAELDLGHNSIFSKGLCALGPALPQHPRMHKLSIWGNKFDSAACAAWLESSSALQLDIAIQEVDGVYSSARKS